QQGGGLGPVVAGGDLGGGQALVPDIPLVERNVDALLVTAGGTHRIGGRGHGVDEAVHVHRAGQEGAQVTVGLGIVGVRGDQVHVLVGVLEDLPFPVAEGGHAGVGGAAQHQGEVLVDGAHRTGGLGRQAAILLGGLVPDLPRAVHLIAQAPEPDVVRRLRAVGAAQVRIVGAVGDIAVFQQVDGFLHPAGRSEERRVGEG